MSAPVSAPIIAAPKPPPAAFLARPTRLDRATVTRAAAALLAHLARTAPGGGAQLLSERATLSLSFHLKRMPARGGQGRPASIGPLPHPLLDPEQGVELCLIAKDDPNEAVREALRRVPVAGLTRVLAVGRLKKDYRDFARRRELVAQFDMFLCDDRVVTMMPKLCGKAFFERKKVPVPVKVSGASAEGVAAAVQRARDSTHALVGAGQTCALKVGTSTMTAAQVADNVMFASGPFASLLPRKWKGVMSVYLQATGTVAIPLLKCLPEIEAEAEDPAGAVAANKAAAGAGTGMEEDEEEVDEAADAADADDGDAMGAEVDEEDVTVLAAAAKNAARSEAAKKKTKAAAKAAAKSAKEKAAGVVEPAAAGSKLPAPAPVPAPAKAKAAQSASALAASAAVPPAASAAVPAAAGKKRLRAPAEPVPTSAAASAPASAPAPVPTGPKRAKTVAAAPGVVSPTLPAVAKAKAPVRLAPMPPQLEFGVLKPHRNLMNEQKAKAKAKDKAAKLASKVGPGSAAGGSKLSGSAGAGGGSSAGVGSVSRAGAGGRQGAPACK